MKSLVTFAIVGMAFTAFALFQAKPVEDFVMHKISFFKLRLSLLRGVALMTRRSIDAAPSRRTLSLDFLLLRFQNIQWPRRLGRGHKIFKVVEQA